MSARCDLPRTFSVIREALIGEELAWLWHVNTSSLSNVAERVSLRARQLASMGKLMRRNLTTSAPAVAPGGPVVSLTSFGKRARTVSFTIESIAQGDLLPSRLLLWLDEPGLLATPTAMLARLKRRGVEVLSTENWGPHKKYFPFVSSQAAFELPLVTADDDVLYPASWLSSLMARYRAHSNDVHCYRARVAGLREGRLTPYATWRECATTEPSHRHFSIGMAGVLFPPSVLRQLRERGSEFRETCPRTDDIWLNLQAQRVGAKVRQVRAAPEYFMLLPGTQKSGLLHSNVQDGNDSALGAVYQPADLERLAGS